MKVISSCLYVISQVPMIFLHILMIFLYAQFLGAKRDDFRLFSSAGASKKRASSAATTVCLVQDDSTVSSEEAGASALGASESSASRNSLHRRVGARGESLWCCPLCVFSSKRRPNLFVHVGRKHGGDFIPPKAG